eukprot:Trichotokara_eunicae@DN7822_c0_g1_i1.p1
MAKRISVSYFFCFFFGIFGAHHLYLGRDHQFLLWASSGGGFTIGWLIDFWRIPQYVAQANRTPKYLEKWQHKKGKKVAKWQIVRGLMSIFFASFYEWTFWIASFN